MLSDFSIKHKYLGPSEMLKLICTTSCWVQGWLITRASPHPLSPITSRVLLHRHAPPHPAFLFLFLLFFFSQMGNMPTPEQGLGEVHILWTPSHCDYEPNKDLPHCSCNCYLSSLLPVLFSSDSLIHIKECLTRNCLLQYLAWVSTDFIAGKTL